MTFPLEDVGTITAQWTDPTGTVWPLSSIDPAVGMFTRPAIGGWGAKTYEITTDPLPRGGVDVRFVRGQEARIVWPLHVYGDTHLQFIQRYRAIKRAIMMTVHRTATGTLRVTRPDGTAREIDCYYADGFGGEPGQDWLSASPAITLMCPDGYWRDTTPMLVVRTSTPGTSFLSPFPTVSSAQVLGATTIDNPGDVTAWPTWTITGPAGSIIATNTTTNQTFSLTYSLAAGEQITITTQRPTVRGPAQENLTASLNWPTAYLWGLLPGTNAVNFTLTGASTLTSVQLAFYPRYEGA